MTQPTDAEPLTFEHLGSRRRGLSDEFVIGALTDSLEVAPDAKTGMIKIYADQVPIDPSDNEFLSNPDNIVNYRNNISDFIARNLKIMFSPGTVSDGGIETLRQVKQAYIEKLGADKLIIEADIRGWIAKSRAEGSEDDRRKRMSAKTFQGLRIPNANGPSVDLSLGSAGNIRSTVHVQNQGFGHGILVDSYSYARERLAGRQPVITRRIYLNPVIKDSVDILQKLTDAINEAGLTTRTKMFDRTYNLVKAIRPDIKEHYLRGDGIVLYVTEGEADDVLALVMQVHKEFAESFKDRRVSRFPTPIGEGIAIGDEPLKEGVSLTSHRSEVLERVIRRVREAAEVPYSTRTLDPRQRQVATEAFRSIWRDEALQSGINPDNLAFNTR